LEKRVSLNHSEKGPGLDVRDALERLHGECFGWALHCCSERRADAEEVLQSAYLKVLSGRARFGGNSSFKTWLLAVIRNTALDQERRNARGAERLNEYQAEVNSRGDIPSPGVELEERETHTELTNALAALPLRQQEVLRLVFYHHLSVSQAAEAMGVSVGTARTHYERAKRQLRDSLAAENERYERRTT
jgi:RNA polymerase sigma-70 factor (ECF subfamily)